MLQDIPTPNPTPALRVAKPFVIETERLTLRKPTLADAKGIAALADDKRIAMMTRRLPHPYSQDDAVQFVKAIAGDSGELAFLIEHNHVPVGVVGGAIGRVRQAANESAANMPVPPPPPPPMRVPAPAHKPEDRRGDWDLSKDKERSQLAAKLDPMLASKAGAVRVKVWLAETSAAVMQQLKAAGLTVTAQPNGAKLVFGTIDTAKLETLAKVAAVTYVSFDLGQP